jgi:hypothetical protein
MPATTALNAKAQQRVAREQEKMKRLGIEKFETVEQCSRRQVKMIKQLKEYGVRGEVLRSLRLCGTEGCGNYQCCEACHFATRQYRINMIPRAARIVGQFSNKIYQATVVHPKWQYPVGSLVNMNIAAAHQWMRRKLAPLENSVLAIGSFEVSLNVEQDGSKHWAGEMTLIVAGSPKQELRNALTPKKPKTQTKAKARRRCPVMVRKVKHLGYQLGYSLKRFGERRIAYVDGQGRQNRRHLPLKKDEQLEFDSWLTTLPIGERTFCFNCRRNGERLEPLLQLI